MSQKKRLTEDPEGYHRRQEQLREAKRRQRQRERERKLRGATHHEEVKEKTIPMTASTASLLAAIAEAEGVNQGVLVERLLVRERLSAQPKSGIKEIFDNGAALRGNKLFAVTPLNLTDNNLSVLQSGRVYEPSEAHVLVTQVLPGLRERVEVKERTKRLPKPTSMEPRLVFAAEREGGQVVVTPEIVYGDPPCGRIEGGRLQYLGGPLPERNPKAERKLASELWEGLSMRPGIGRRAAGQDALRMAESVRDFGAPVIGDGLDACFVAPALTPEIQFDEDRVELTFHSEHDGKTYRASANAVFNAWQNETRLVALDTGGWAPLPVDFLSKHGHLVADLLAARTERDELPPSAGADVARLCEALEQPAPPDFTALRDLANGFEGIGRAELPSDLGGELRDYQKEGVDWLAFLSQAGLGGLLADDMGLGKTLQALCVLQTPALIVCPSSVVHAWHDELSRFRPSLQVGRFHGPTRQLRETDDVTLTTYALLRRDADLLSSQKWGTVVLDEAQHIKNPDSQVARASYQLDADFRMALTGTPVENRLEDLWSQMHFLNPGLLGGLGDFRERYVKPITNGDGETTLRLRRRIRPFLLRRLKSQVAQELPPRTDVVLRCELSDRERAAYDAVRAATREEVVRELSAGGNVLAALEALLRLRQACCHTGLLPGHEADSSAKLALLMETLEGVLAEGHRALIFSQWTSFLDLVEPHLSKASVPFVRLDGSTRDREEVVRTFQSEEGPPIMLISLKAGGVGLTLTRADHVFLLDPWWNPAVEDQAADRIHRIGQEHPVLVHRLVAADTVEEQLLALQEKKRALSAAALSDDGPVTTGGASGLTRDDLLALLS